MVRSCQAASMVIEAASCCSACGASNPAQARFCNQCTSPLGAASSSSLAHAERKQVTVLFSDLSGFTALTERLDPEETREIMSRVFGHAADIVAPDAAGIVNLKGIRIQRQILPTGQLR